MSVNPIKLLMTYTRPISKQPITYLQQSLPSLHPFKVQITQGLGCYTAKVTGVNNFSLSVSLIHSFSSEFIEEPPKEFKVTKASSSAYLYAVV